MEVVYYLLSAFVQDYAMGPRVVQDQLLPLVLQMLHLAFPVLDVDPSLPDKPVVEQMLLLRPEPFLLGHGVCLRCWQIQLCN